MFSRRYLAMWSAVALLAVYAALAATHYVSWLWIVVPLAFIALGCYDLAQQRHAILRNYPLWGHLRFLFEFIRPEIRQYFVAYTRRDLRRNFENHARRGLASPSKATALDERGFFAVGFL